MNELAKWVWFIILTILFLGPVIFIILGVSVFISILVAWLKPEWLKKY